MSEPRTEVSVGRRLMDTLQRPFRSIVSLRTKLALIIVAAIFAAAGFQMFGYYLNVPYFVRPFIMAAAAFVVVRVLSKGTITPLVRMEAAAAQLVAGDRDTPIEIAPSHTLGADEIGRLAVTFERMRSELLTLDRQRRELMANVSHELRTPLAAVQAHMENMVDGVTEPSEATMRLMLTQLERLSVLVSDLMDLAQLEAGVRTLARRRIDLIEVVSAARDEFAITHPGGQLVVDAPESLFVYGDPDRLHQVLVNLLNNAARHSPKDVPVTLRISDGRVRDGAGDGGVPPRRSEAAGHVVVDVIDHGPGIPVDQRQHVFQRFYRADAARSTDDGGVGLGLAIVNEIISLHGGTILATDQDGRGCLMRIDLPGSSGVGDDTQPKLKIR